MSVRRILCLFAASAAVPVSVARGQVAIGAQVRDRAAAGFEMEQYLRALQDVGETPLYPWSVRAFGPQEIQHLLPADSTHPWHTRIHRSARRFDAYIIAPELGTIYNTSFPYGYNDGPLWAGRGLTSYASFGFGIRAGPVSLIVDPEAFRAQNTAFELQSTGLSGPLAFADPYAPTIIDQPQRFGASAYQRLDPGQSTLRVDAGPIALGASTANEYWGPAAAHPMLLGNNAAGFPHVFVGTSRPLNLWLVSVHTRAIWGRLDQSDYSPRTSGETRRFGTGLVGLITIRGLPGLELGASRFFHVAWPVGGPKAVDFRRPFQLNAFAASRANLAGQDPTNQLASLFGRWAIPAVGIEAYGEFGRDDFGTDLHDVVVEPDHESAYMLGLQRAMKLRGNRLFVLRAEVLNSRITQLTQLRGQEEFYTHTEVVQGHTEYGQVLGSIGAKGGGASELTADLYVPSGRWSVGWSRRVVDSSNPGSADVLHAISVDRLWFGSHADIRAGITQAVELNRRPETDVGNMNLRLSTELHW